MLAIFDLDQTLVDSQVCEPLRRSRQWRKVYDRIPELALYAGISDLLLELRNAGIDLAIVTSSPRPYCERMVRQFKMPVTNFICYHDTANHKPHPDPILAAINRCLSNPAETVAVGDDAKDVYAARAANVVAIASVWGCADRSALEAAEPDVVCATVEQLRDTLLKFQTRLGG
jgi:HAD superfamily hydrolase (TIGR01549 family)